MDQFKKNIIQKFSLYQVKIELTILFIFSIGLLLFDNQIELGAILIIVSLGLIANVYFFLSFQFTDSKDVKKIFLNKLTYLSFSVSTVGILFSILNWPNAHSMLLSGLFSLIISLAARIILRLKKKEKMIDAEIFRMIIVTVIALSVY